VLQTLQISLTLQASISLSTCKKAIQNVWTYRLCVCNLLKRETVALGDQLCV